MRLENHEPQCHPPHLQLGIQVRVGRHHMLVLFLPGDLDERLLGFPVLLLELVHHGRVLALDETVKIVLGVATAMTQKHEAVTAAVQAARLFLITVKVWHGCTSVLTNFLPPFFRIVCGQSRASCRVYYLIGAMRVGTGQND